METEYKDNASQNEANTKEKENSFKDKFLRFLGNNKGALFISFVLIIVVVWFTVKLLKNENKFKQEKMQLISQHEVAIDSLKVKNLTFATEVFSWSVRSEMLRNNAENLNQLLTEFIQKSGADLVQIVNLEDRLVILSSDKKFEGKKFAGNLNVKLSETSIVREEGLVTISTPIMGFNAVLGILIVEISM